MVFQTALVPAGCQPWNYDVLAVSESRFAYAASLAIYIYEIDVSLSNKHQLVSIMSEHTKTIKCICWCPQNSDLLASCSDDNTVIVWDVTKQKATGKVSLKEKAYSLSWLFGSRICLGVLTKQGPLRLWHVTDNQNLSLVKDATFNSAVLVFRWHHTLEKRVAFGHLDGSFSILDIGGKLLKQIMKPEEEDDDEVFSVSAIEWDPLSSDYLLVCNKNLRVRLVDVLKQITVMNFELPSAASKVHTITWVENAPGMFITGDYRVGILRVWSVSSPSPIENIKIKNEGFHCVQVLHNFQSKENSSFKQETFLPKSSTSQGKKLQKLKVKKYSLPPVQVVSAFADGGIGVYDIRNRKWVFLQELGHTETIFDCKFCPENPDHLATSSFDGSIKIWDTTTMECIDSSPNSEDVIYHISWAPADLGCIAACTARSGVFIWDVKKGKTINKINNHAPKTCVYCLSWNQINSKLLMTVGADCYCVIQQVDGQVISKYKHPASLYGCDWSPFNKDMFATGCEDKCVRVFLISSNSDHPMKILSGHEAKVFHVRWNPIKEGVLCSGSDDNTIRVWDYTKEQCTSILKGHTKPVRGLAWNPEVVSLLASGSWDYTIRFWDTRDGACLNCVVDHGADVYGLTIHPLRPFVLASSSRDSTVRLWSLTSLVKPLELQLLIGQKFNLKHLEKGLSADPTSEFSLSGKVSKDLESKIKLKGMKFPAVLEEYSKFFMKPSGLNNIWDLVSVLKDIDTFSLSPSYGTSIVHRKHLTKFQISDAQHLEMVNMSKFGSGIGAPSKEDSLKQAAKIHIRLGNVQRYCELMLELGQWERALSVAPAVSMKYWKQLTQRYCDYLMEEESEDLLPFGVACGDVDMVSSFLSSQGQLTDALTVAQSAVEGSICQPNVKDVKKGAQDQAIAQHNENLASGALKHMAITYFQRGSPTLAACCHLADDDIKSAMSKLIRGNELELALCVGQALNDTKEELDIVLELLSRRCEALGKWELGLDILKLHTNPTDKLGRLCARCSSSMAEINALHYKASLPPMELCEKKAKDLEASGTDIHESVLHYILSTSPEIGLQKGLQFIRSKLSSPDWTTDDVFPMLQLLACIKTERLQHSKNLSLTQELLFLSAYIGAFVAVKRGYLTIALPLLRHSKQLLTKRNFESSISAEDVETYMTCVQRNSASSVDDKEYKTLLSHCGCDDAWVLETGIDCVASSHLPSHSDVHVSALTQTRIKGQAFFLEDGMSVISLNEALMWAKVNAFSPLGSAMRINPF